VEIHNAVWGAKSDKAVMTNIITAIYLIKKTFSCVISVAFDKFDVEILQQSKKNVKQGVMVCH
jgi:hypothetical protein